jgi:hypothetical protein
MVFTFAFYTRSTMITEALLENLGVGPGVIWCSYMLFTTDMGIKGQNHRTAVVALTIAGV